MVWLMAVDSLTEGITITIMAADDVDPLCVHNPITKVLQITTINHTIFSWSWCIFYSLFFLSINHFYDTKWEFIVGKKFSLIIIVYKNICQISSTTLRDVNLGLTVVWLAGRWIIDDELFNSLDVPTKRQITFAILIAN